MKDFKEIAKSLIQNQYTNTNVFDLNYNVSDVLEKYFGNIVDKVNYEILNFNTCNSSVLDNFWGQIFKINRRFKGIDGKIFVLTDDEYREIIKIRAFGTTWDGSVNTINTFLKELFKDRGKAYMLDSQNMKYEIFNFAFELKDFEKHLFIHEDILPRPAGVYTSITTISDVRYFGYVCYDEYIHPIIAEFGTYKKDSKGEFKTYKDN